MTARRLTDIKTLHAWEFADSKTGEDSVFNGCIPSFRPFHTTPEFCRIQNQFWLAEAQPGFALLDQSVFALARYDAAAFALALRRAKFCWPAEPQLGAHFSCRLIVPPTHLVLRRGSLRFILRSKRRLVPATGIEPVTSGL